MTELGKGGAAGLAPVLALRPDLATLYGDLLERLWTDTDLDPVLLELCRLRQATLLGCQAEVGRRTSYAIDAGLREDQVASLASWPTAETFGEVERACLAYTEAFVVDPHGVDDEQAATVRALIGEDGLVALTMALGLYDGVCRLHLALEVP
jgi:alkylhydroperoxidase family enzyme